MRQTLIAMALVKSCPDDARAVVPAMELGMLIQVSR
jgi:hypothetical protein